MRDWRKNPNLVECFDNSVAMFRAVPEARPVSRGDLVRSRRIALGLTGEQLAQAAGYSGATTRSIVTRVELGSHWYQRIADTLDRLEAERAQADAAE